MTTERLEFASLFQRRTSERIKPGLDRMRLAWDALGRPAFAIPAVLIAGTNGKGTTASYLKNLCHAGGLRAGIYTSPHLVHFRERVQMSDERIDDEALYGAWEKIRASLERTLYDELSFFELATLMALMVFADRRPDVLILEVGLGGRWDATNIVDPVASVVVSVGLDHCEFLGSTLETILAEKLGVARRGRPLFVGRDVIGRSAACDEVLRQHLTSVGFDLRPTELADDEATESYLRHNYRLAARVYEYLAAQVVPKARPLAAIEADHPAPWLVTPLTGRLTRMSVPLAGGGIGTVLLDVCHNPHGVEAALRALRALPDAPRRAIVSILRDKDIPGMLDLFQSFFEDVVLFKIPSERTFTRDHLPSRHQSLRTFESFAEAWKSVSMERGAEDPWAICGSVLAVGHVLEFFGRNPENDLRSASSRLDGSGDVAR